jgi:hypothetical protein
MRYRWVSELARQFGVPPHIITNLFYKRELCDQTCPVVGGRRIIPAAYVPEIERVLRERGRLPNGREHKEPPQGKGHSADQDESGE